MTTDQHKSVPTRLWGALLALAALTLVAELLVEHHAAFGIDGSYAFYGWFTLGVGVAAVLIARVLGLVLGRREDDDA